MASLKVNIVSNVIGKCWSAAIVILLIPLYIKYLGIESYGLIGFYTTLIGSMSLLDLGLSTTLLRELAKYKEEKKPVEDIRNLTFSLECIYWGIGLLISLVVIAFSGLIAEKWINVETLSHNTVRQAVIVIGLVIAFQWPISLYNGGLYGLDKQVLSNAVNIVMSTIRSGGAILVLMFFSPTIQAFFAWQAISSILFVLTLRWGLWKNMPSFTARARFSKSQLKLVWKFAAGMTSIALVTFFVTQLDKIILSKILLLSQFGYYTLAFSIATTLALLSAPISTSFFPKMTALYSASKNEELATLYHKASRFMSVTIFPCCFMLVFFMSDILLIWTRDPVVVENTSQIARFLVIGSTFNALMVIPYNLLIASGRTRFSFYQNSIASVVMIPLLFLLTSYYGAEGAAFTWILLNAGYILIAQPLIHRRLLKGHLARWYIFDSFIPMLPSLLVMLLIKSLLVYIWPQVQLNLFVLGAIFATGFGISVLAVPEFRKMIFVLIKRN